MTLYLALEPLLTYHGVANNWLGGAAIQGDAPGCAGSVHVQRRSPVEPSQQKPLTHLLHSSRTFGAHHTHLEYRIPIAVAKMLAIGRPLQERRERLQLKDAASVAAFHVDQIDR